MKCINCGANLESVAGTEIKFCPYCGAKFETENANPVTLAGAIHGIGQTILKQKAAREAYEREHHAEIQAEKEKEEKKSRNTVLLMLLLMFVVPVIAWALGKLFEL